MAKEMISETANSLMHRGSFPIDCQNESPAICGGA